MREQFVGLFMARLEHKIPDADLSIVEQELQLFINDYDVTKRETDLVPYKGYLPECYKVYIVTKKIEGMSLKTLELYKLYLEDFFRVMNKELSEIDTNDIRLYLYNVQQERGLSNRTLDGRRSAIHAFLEWATNEEYILRNPCRNIKPIKYEVRERNPLTGIELEKVRQACETDRETAIIETLYSTGCRVTELERLNKSDVDFEKKEVMLYGNGDKHRVSYLNARAELSLKAYLEGRSDKNPALFIYTRKPFGRLKKSGIEKIVRTIGKRAGLDRNLHPHLIRHTTATDGLNRGMDVTEVQQLLGHTRIDTTMIYAKASKGRTKADHTRCII